MKIEKGSKEERNASGGKGDQKGQVRSGDPIWGEGRSNFKDGI